MLTLQFHGLVRPLEHEVTLTYRPWVRWEDHNTGLDAKFEIVINKNKCVVHCTTNRFDQQRDLPYLMVRAYDTAKSVIDLISFATGATIHFWIETVVFPDGRTEPHIFRHAELEAIATAAQGANFEASLQIVQGEFQALFALRHLTEAISAFHLAPASCARAIDAIRVHFRKRDDTEKGWALLRSSLNLNRPYIEYVMKLSHGPRHGDHHLILGVDIQEALKRSWTVMNRFLEYKKRGDQPLPLGEFPALD